MLTVPITVDGKSFTKKFTWSLSLTGAKGDKGDQGAAGYMIVIDPSNGSMFKTKSQSTTLTCRIYQGGVELDTGGSYSYVWTRTLKDGTVDSSFSRTGKSITVSTDEVDDRSKYKCTVTF